MTAETETSGAGGGQPPAPPAPPATDGGDEREPPRPLDSAQVAASVWAELHHTSTPIHWAAVRSLLEREAKPLVLALDALADERLSR